MPNTNKYIKPDGFDLMLKEVFLELDFNNPKNKNLLQNSAMYALEINAMPQTMNPKSNLLKDIIGKIGLQILIYSSVIIIGIVVSTFYFQNKKTSSSEIKINNEIIQNTTKATPTSISNYFPIEHMHHPRISKTENADTVASPLNDSIVNVSQLQLKDPEIYTDTNLVKNVQKDTVIAHPSKEKKDNKYKGDLQKMKKKKVEWREHEVK